MREFKRGLGPGLATMAVVVGLAGLAGCSKHGGPGGSVPVSVAAPAPVSSSASAPSPPALAGPITAQALATALTASGVQVGAGLSVTRPMACGKGRDPADPSVHCTTVYADAARGGRAASLEIMVFDQGADFEARDGKIKAAIEAVRGRFAVEHSHQTTISNPKTGKTLTLHDRCYQSRGATNSDAFCVSEAGDHAVVLAEAAAAQASSNGVSTEDGSPSFEDIEHASDLASRGALAVTKLTD
jgi:hypothetical protein